MALAHTVVEIARLRLASDGLLQLPWANCRIASRVATSAWASWILEPTSPMNFRPGATVICRSERVKPKLADDARRLRTFNFGPVWAVVVEQCGEFQLFL